MLESRRPNRTRGDRIWTQTLSGQTVVRGVNGVVTAGVTDDLVLLDLKQSIYYGLSETGPVIWQLLREPRTVEDLVRRVLAEYPDAEQERVGCEVRQLLRDLARPDVVVTRG